LVNGSSTTSTRWKIVRYCDTGRGGPLSGRNKVSGGGDDATGEQGIPTTFQQAKSRFERFDKGELP
jgi:hypothetical protein